VPKIQPQHPILALKVRVGGGGGVVAGLGLIP